MAELTCRAFIEFVDGYVDETQLQPLRVEFERHLAGCLDCVDYLNSYRETIATTRDACAADPSSALRGDVPDELVDAIIRFCQGQ